MSTERYNVWDTVDFRVAPAGGRVYLVSHAKPDVGGSTVDLAGWLVLDKYQQMEDGLVLPRDSNKGPRERRVVAGIASEGIVLPADGEDCGLGPTAEVVVIGPSDNPPGVQEIEMLRAAARREHDRKRVQWTSQERIEKAFEEKN